MERGVHAASIQKFIATGAFRFAVFAIPKRRERRAPRRINIGRSDT